jgi:hypothetical protein
MLLLHPVIHRLGWFVCSLMGSLCLTVSLILIATALLFGQPVAFTSLRENWAAAALINAAIYARCWCHVTRAHRLPPALAFYYNIVATLGILQLTVLVMLGATMLCAAVLVVNK